MPVAVCFVKSWLSPVCNCCIRSDSFSERFGQICKMRLIFMSGFSVSVL